jgi:hypothetical protein
MDDEAHPLAPSRPLAPTRWMRCRARRDEYEPSDVRTSSGLCPWRVSWFYRIAADRPASLGVEGGRDARASCNGQRLGTRFRMRRQVFWKLRLEDPRSVRQRCLCSSRGATCTRLWASRRPNGAHATPSRSMCQYKACRQKLQQVFRVARQDGTESLSSIRSCKQDSWSHSSTGTGTYERSCALISKSLRPTSIFAG